MNLIYYVIMIKKPNLLYLAAALYYLVLWLCDMDKNIKLSLIEYLNINILHCRGDSR